MWHQQVGSSVAHCTRCQTWVRHPCSRISAFQDIVVPNSHVTVIGIAWTEEPQGKASIYRDKSCVSQCPRGIGIKLCCQKHPSIQRRKEANWNSKTQKQRCPLLSFLRALSQQVKVRPIITQQVMHCPKQVVVLSSIDSVTSKITGLFENFSFFLSFFLLTRISYMVPFAKVAFFLSVVHRGPHYLCTRM